MQPGWTFDVLSDNRAGTRVDLSQSFSKLRRISSEGDSLRVLIFRWDLDPDTSVLEDLMDTAMLSSTDVLVLTASDLAGHRLGQALLNNR